MTVPFFVHASHSVCQVVTQIRPEHVIVGKRLYVSSEVYLGTRHTERHKDAEREHTAVECTHQLVYWMEIPGKV